MRLEARALRYKRVIPDEDSDLHVGRLISVREKQASHTRTHLLPVDIAKNTEEAKEGHRQKISRDQPTIKLANDDTQRKAMFSSVGETIATKAIPRTL